MDLSTWQKSDWKNADKAIQVIKSLIRDVQDFPKKGILFKWVDLKLKNSSRRFIFAKSPKDKIFWRLRTCFSVFYVTAITLFKHWILYRPDI